MNGLIEYFSSILRLETIALAPKSPSIARPNQNLLCRLRLAVQLHCLPARLRVTFDLEAQFPTDSLTCAPNRAG
jgi:hypothetical protein